MFKLLRRAFVLFLVLLAAGYGFAEAWATNKAADVIARRVADRDPFARDVEATVGFPFLYNLVVGSRISEIELSTTHVDVGPFIADRATGKLTGVKVDRWASLKERKPVVRSIERGHATITVTSAELSKILPRGFSLRFNPNGSIELAGPGGASVAGELVIVDGSDVRFDPEAPGLPPGVPVPIWRIAGIPFVRCADILTVTAGRLEIGCTIDDPPPSLLGA